MKSRSRLGSGLGFHDGKHLGSDPARCAEPDPYPDADPNPSPNPYFNPNLYPNPNPNPAGGASSAAARPARRNTRGKHGRAASESADEGRVPSPALRKKRSRRAERCSPASPHNHSIMLDPSPAVRSPGYKCGVQQAICRCTDRLHTREQASKFVLTLTMGRPQNMQPCDSRA